jgi:magnesium chelatase family protein
MTSSEVGEDSVTIRARVTKAREIAQQRYQTEQKVRCNAQMQPRHLRQYCQLDQSSRGLLENAIQKLGLSARAMDRILKVSRTIADLASEENIKSHHLAEAIQYRTIDRLM